jgi:RNA polymerase sigma-70 factor (ECF subfamily)
MGRVPFWAAARTEGKLVDRPDLTVDQHRLPDLELSDEALVVQICQRDQVAFAALYDRYVRPVYVMAAHLLDPGEAEEMVQEVFLRLWLKADHYAPDRGAFRPWFMSVARHHVLDRLRRRGHRHAMFVAESLDEMLATPADPSATVEEAAWLRERRRAVLAAIHSLPPEQRRVLVLAYFGGLSQSVIAASLGWPLGTVKKRVRLGLHKLRTALAQYSWAANDEADDADPDYD